MKLFHMLVLLATMSLAVPARALPKPDVAKLAQSRADAAAKVYPEALMSWRNGTTVGLEEVYQWSVRWLAATLDAAGKPAPALADHLKRMQELELQVIDRNHAQLVSAQEVDAAGYYRAEAELWQARGKMN
jgi:hypothetical protein